MTDTALNSVGILVVEDEALVARDIRNRLEEIGHRVLGLARTPDQALTLAQSCKPDLLLCDIHLKRNIDGIEVARRVNEIKETPVVFLTAYSDEETLSRAKSIAPYGYVLKPIETPDLKIAIEMALHRYSLDKQAGQLKSATPPTAAASAAWAEQDNSGLEAKLEDALRAQIRHCLDARELQPLSHWLERDLILAALEIKRRINLRAAELLEMPESTLRRKLVRYQADSGPTERGPTERGPTDRGPHAANPLWAAVQNLLPQWLHACRRAGKNPIHAAQLLLLRLIEENVERRTDAAVLAGVSAPTYRRKVQELT
ncbi:MAG: response regulator [Pseudomonadota bacterium]